MTTPGVKAQMPKNVRLALVGVWVQAVLNVVAGFLLLAVVSDAVDHGQDEGTGLLRFVAVLSLLIAGVLLLCGVFARTRSNGIRVTVIVIEALSLLSSVVGLLEGGGVGVVPGIVLPLVVLRGAASAEARNWFDK
ncbi:hypothetical protein [Streptomyces sp. MBT65]|uniref:hypothetical protein n=1 Tax=Streptomyces sp. MBT65 TaxID=1488395 RepID=UPI001F30B561|nr:hypothetical protein [Streptomyces sp. MBT65]